MTSSAQPLPPASSRIEVDGRPIDAERGLSLAAALLRAGIRRCAKVPDGLPRGAFCMMGVCQECLVEVDGVQRQACLVAIEPGMQIVTRAPA